MAPNTLSKITVQEERAEQYMDVHRFEVAAPVGTLTPGVQQLGTLAEPCHGQNILLSVDVLPLTGTCSLRARNFGPFFRHQSWVKQRLPKWRPGNCKDVT